jgi:hypothetical protein
MEVVIAGLMIAPALPVGQPAMPVIDSRLMSEQAAWR